MRLPVFTCLLLTTAAHAGPTLDHIKQTHALQCGVVTNTNDESKDDTHGDLSAFGTDICTAIGAATLGAIPTVRIHQFPAEAQAYQALQSHQIDVIVGATPNPGLARRYNIAYLHPVFFDSQGLLVHKDRGIASLRDLAGKHICFIGTTAAEDNLRDATTAAHIQIAPFPFEEIGEMEAALVGGQCDAETHDISKLAAGRAAFHGRIHDFEILPDHLSLDPFAPVIRTDDPDWARVIDWTTATLIQAEILGVTRANVDALRASPLQSVQTLTGARRGLQWGLYLNDDWSYQIIKTVGNYSEVLDRTVGPQSPLNLPNGVNVPWTKGGMLYGTP